MNGLRARILQGVRVLLVDDEPDSLAAVCVLLELNGAAWWR
jgi:hypothetical protein